MRRRDPNSRFARGMRQDAARNKAINRAGKVSDDRRLDPETYDLADWACCDTHGTTYLIGEKCPRCQP